MENKVMVRSSIRTALPQVLAIMVKNTLLIAYGMVMGFPTILIPHLSQENPSEEIHLSQEDISWIGSLAMLCVPAGCILSGILTPPIGRKKAMQFMCTPFLICGVIFKYAEEPWQIFLALALTGCVGGFLEAPITTYAAEVTQPHLRGMLSATGSLAVLLGTFAEFVLGTFYDWRTLALLCGIPSTAAFCLLYFIPESPYWLVMHNRHDEAKKGLAWLRGWVTLPEIEEEFQILLVLQKNKNIEESVNKNNFSKKYFGRGFIRPLALLSFMFFLSHFTGMTTLQTYSVHIFEVLRSPVNSYYSTILLGAAQFLGSLVCVITIRFIGKRSLIFLSLGISLICFITAGSYAYLTGVKYFYTKNLPDNGSIFNNYKWIPVPCLITAAFALQGGIRVLPWILVGELYTTETRAMGSGFSGAIAYIFGFATNKLFFKTIAFLTLPGTFWLYSCVGILGIIILYIYLPETEGKSLEEINGHFEGTTKLDNKVGKRNCYSHNECTESRL